MTVLALFLLTGAATGVLAGLFGVGGGLLMVPVLGMLLPQQGLGEAVALHLAIGTSLAVIAATALSSAAAHHRRGSVDWRVLRAFAPGLGLGALAGAFVAVGLSAQALRQVIGLGAIAVALNLALGGPRREGEGEGPQDRRPPAPELLGAGGVIGLLSSLIGIGGGAMTVPYLVLRGLGVRQAVGTSAAGGVPLAWCGALGFVLAGWGVQGLPPLSLGYVSLSGFAALASTSVVTAPLGARLAHRLPPLLLRRAFAVLLVGIGAKMLWG